MTSHGFVQPSSTHFSSLSYLPSGQSLSSHLWSLQTMVSLTCSSFYGQQRYASWLQRSSMIPSSHDRPDEATHSEWQSQDQQSRALQVQMTLMLVLLSGLKPRIHFSRTCSYLSSLAMSIFLGAQHSLAYSMASLTQLPYTLPPFLSDKLLHESTGNNYLISPGSSYSGNYGNLIFTISTDGIS